VLEERALTFACEGDQLVGIVSLPSRPCTRGVLIVVGGPQYRVGAHRQFALLARSLAQDGVAAMRFDYRGMGDSGGEARAFDDIGADLRAAADRFMAELPQLRELVIWGLCDGASAALLYAHQDARVRGLVLLNPWARTEEGHAKATLKHYYGARLFDPHFWRKLASGRFAFGDSLRSLLGFARRAAGTAAPADAALPARLLDGLRRFDGPVLLIMSGEDLTAREFSDVTAGSPAWRRELASQRVTRRDLPGADHTCSSHPWREQVNGWTAEWVKALG
jgi:exosortase A-associated hydrolase 1